MKFIKRYFGLILLVLAPVILFIMVNGALSNINPEGTKEINNPVIWIIILTIFTPIALGLVIFGWYAFRGEYDQLADSSDDL